MYAARLAIADGIACVARRPQKTVDNAATGEKWTAALGPSSRSTAQLSGAADHTLVDRFAQHCHVLDIDAESWRAKSSLRRKGKPKPQEDED